MAEIEKQRNARVALIAGESLRQFKKPTSHECVAAGLQLSQPRNGWIAAVAACPAGFQRSCPPSSIGFASPKVFLQFRYLPVDFLEAPDNGRQNPFARTFVGRAVQLFRLTRVSCRAQNRFDLVEFLPRDRNSFGRFLRTIFLTL